MSTPDPFESIARLKAARRAELEAAAEAARRLAAELAEERQRRLAAAVVRILAQQDAAYLGPFAEPLPTVEAGDRRTSVRFNVPGHRPVWMCLDGGAAAWEPANPNITGRYPWIGTAANGRQESTHELVDALLLSEVEGWEPPAADRGPVPEVEHVAREAWAAAVQPKDPMPPGFAIDMVQTEAGERDEAVSALHRAAAAWLDTHRPPRGEEQLSAFEAAASCAAYLAAESYHMAEACRREVAAVAQQALADHAARPDPDQLGTPEPAVARAWLAWADAAGRAVELLLAVSVAAHPEAVSV